MAIGIIMMNWVAIVVSYFLALIKKVISKIIPTPPDTKITQEATEADFLPSCFDYPHQLDTTLTNIAVTCNPAQIINQSDVSQNNPDDNIANSSNEDSVVSANTVTEPRYSEPHQEFTSNQTAPKQEFTPYETEPDQEYTLNKTEPDQEFTQNETVPDREFTPNETVPHEEVTPNETEIKLIRTLNLKDKVDWLKHTNKVQADMTNTCAMHCLNVKLKISEGMSWEEILKEYSSLSCDENDKKVIIYLVDTKYLPGKDSHEETLRHYKKNGLTNAEFKFAMEKMHCPDLWLKTKQHIGRILHQFKPGTYFLYHKRGSMYHVTLLSTEIRGKKPLFFDSNGGCDEYYEVPNSGNSGCNKYLKYLKDKVE